MAKKRGKNVGLNDDQILTLFMASLLFIFFLLFTFKQISVGTVIFWAILVLVMSGVIKGLIATKPKGKLTQARAYTALIVNIFYPGLGTLIAGKIMEGLIQISLFTLGIPLMFVLIGFPLMGAVWIWAFITGLQLIKESEE